MATNLSPLEQVLQASAPAMAYQPDEYDLAEQAYYANADRVNASLGKGKDAEVAPFPPRQPQYIPPPVEQPVPQPVAQPQVPTPLSQAITPQQAPTTLTPCDLGMCDGLSYGTNGQYTVASSAPTGKFMMNSGHAGGRNLLGQMLVAGMLERQGATVEQLEKNNMRTELADLNDMRRSDVWSTNYNNLVAQGLDPRIAGAQADRLTGNQLGGDFNSLTNRYADPVNQARVQALTDEASGRLLSVRAIDQIGLANAGVSGGYQPVSVTSITPNADGTYTTNLNVNGRNVQGAPTAPNRLMSSLTGAISPNASTGATNVLVNAQQTAENAVTQANNTNQYNQLTAGINVLEAQNLANNRVTQNAIAQQNANTRVTEAENRVAVAEAKANAKTTQNMPKEYQVWKPPTPPTSQQGIAQARADANDLSYMGFAPNGAYGPKTLSNFPQGGEHQLYNNALAIDPRDGTYSRDPQALGNALITLRQGIQHAERQRDYWNKLPNSADANQSRRNRIGKQTVENNLSQMRLVENDLYNRYANMRKGQ